MKKITHKNKKWFISRSKDELKRKQFLRIKNKLRNEINCKKGAITLLVPAILDIVFKPKRIKLINFLIKLRQASTCNKVIYIDFSQTEKMIADATLLLYSEIKRLNQLFPDNIIRCVKSNFDKTNAVLDQIGLFELLKFNYLADIEYEDVIYWKVTEGVSAEGEKYDNVLGVYDDRLDKDTQNNFYKGITEAMTNSIKHAYIAERNDGLNIKNDLPKWWMFSQEKDGFLTVTLCDLGIGIPRSLPIVKKSLFNLFIKLNKNKIINDVECIKEALRYSSTRTKKSNRGKGLHDISAWVKSFNNASLYIYSNKGLYKHTQGVDKTINYSSSILGTIITWRVPLPKSEL